VAADRDAQVLIEFQVLGAYVKVSAIDPVSNTEVSLVGDAAAPRMHLEELVLRKLKRALNPPKSPAPAPPPASPRRGVIV
jgi:hypothetical protein